MKEESLRTYIVALVELATAGEQSIAGASQVLQGTLGVMRTVYGPTNLMATQLLNETKVHTGTSPGSANAIHAIRGLCRGALKNILAELDAGLLGSLQSRIAGEVLTDLVVLSKEALSETGEGAKNVAAVLAAAAFEDTLRRLAAANGIPHHEKLADTLTSLKEGGLLKGAQIGIAQSYLNFRNKAMHAQWDGVDRASVSSAVAFVEQLLLEHFT